MKNFGQCKCGRVKYFGSEGPDVCSRCYKCGTSAGGRKPEEHEFTAKSSVETDEGMKVISRCKYCHKTRGQIKREEEYFNKKS